MPGGRDIAFKTLGGDGPDLVLIHGFGSDRLSWIGNSPALMQVARVHALDLPGHGESSVDVKDGIPAGLAGALLDALSLHGIAGAHLVGHSLGGGLALLMAAANPHLARSLSLIAPAGLGRGIDSDFLAGLPELQSLDAALTSLRRLVVRPELINRMTAQRLLTQLDRDGTRAAWRAIASGLVAGEPALQAAALTVAAAPIPRLVIWGAGDSINRLDPDRLQDFGGETHVVEAAGHVPHIDHFKTVNDRLTAFLQPLYKD